MFWMWLVFDNCNDYQLQNYAKLWLAYKYKSCDWRNWFANDFLDDIIIYDP